jgi:hypothetical protein
MSLSNLRSIIGQVGEHVKVRELLKVREERPPRRGPPPAAHVCDALLANRRERANLSTTKRYLAPGRPDEAELMSKVVFV